MKVYTKFLFFMSMIFIVVLSHATELTKEEVKGLIYMRQEEKLARDIYFRLFEKWNYRVFLIGNSEQVHMDTLFYQLIKKYNIKDPVTDNTSGKFKDSSLKKIFNELLEKGNKSLQDAFIVGAMIEDINMYHLQKYIKEAIHDDVKDVYEFLLCGSKNHMRAFYGQIVNNNGEYAPRYISKQEFSEIVNSGYGGCFGGPLRGHGYGPGGRHGYDSREEREYGSRERRGYGSRERRGYGPGRF